MPEEQPPVQPQPPIPVETVDVKMSVPKESKEVVDAVSGLISHFANGGDLAGAAAYLPAVMAGVDGWEKLGGELESKYQDEAGGYLVWKLWGSLKKDGQ